MLTCLPAGRNKFSMTNTVSRLVNSYFDYGKDFLKKKNMKGVNKSLDVIVSAVIAGHHAINMKH